MRTMSRYESPGGEHEDRYADRVPDEPRQAGQDADPGRTGPQHTGAGRSRRPWRGVEPVRLR